MKKITLLIVGLTVSFNALLAQDNYGYYGKKNFVDISSSSYFPLLYNLFNYDTSYELSTSGNSLLERRSKFNIGVRASIGRAIKSNVGFALEVGYDRFEIYQNVFNDDYTTTQGFYVDRNENVAVNSILILPRFEFSGPNGLLPNGLVHQVGFGVTINKAVSKNYLLVYDYYSASGSVTTGGPNADPSEAASLMKAHNLDKSAKILQFMYGLKMRTPLGKSMMLNYGFRYTLDFGLSVADVGVDNGTNYAFYNDVRRYQFRNLIAFDLGITLPF